MRCTRAPAGAVVAETGSAVIPGVWLTVRAQRAARSACAAGTCDRDVGSDRGASGAVRALRGQYRRNGRRCGSMSEALPAGGDSGWRWLAAGLPRSSLLDQLTKPGSSRGSRCMTPSPCCRCSTSCMRTTTGAAFSFLAGRRRLAALVLHAARAGASVPASSGALRRLDGRRSGCSALGLDADRQRRARQRRSTACGYGYVVDFVARALGRRLFPGIQRCRQLHHHRRRTDAAGCAAGMARERACARQVSERMQILLASPRGFCAGVDRAIDIVERAIELFGAPIYVRHEVVHNRHVVERLRALGARVRRGAGRGARPVPR